MTAPTVDQDDKCECCGSYRSSMTTRYIFGRKFCVQCGNFINVRLKEPVDEMIDDLISEFQITLSRTI